MAGREMRIGGTCGSGEGLFVAAAPRIVSAVSALPGVLRRCVGCRRCLAAVGRWAHSRAELGWSGALPHPDV